MAKKRQLDFAKSQLRAGRQVSKRRNSTSTNVKVRKLSIQNKPHKKKSEKTIPECMKNFMGSNNVSQKVENLNHLTKLIRDQSDSFYLYLTEILESVFKAVLEVDDNLRNAALQVIMIILEATDDSQIHSFVPHLINVISCDMKHGAHRIKTSSLALLGCMLKNHPDLICHSMTTLDDLLQMVNEPPRISPTRATPNLSVRNEIVYSGNYQINVLGHMNVFLKEMLKNKTFIVDNDRDEQKIYWNCESPLNLVIYAGGGLQPVDIEKSYSDGFDHQDAYFDHSGGIEKFIDDIVDLLPKIFIEEIGIESKADDNMHRPETIKNLNILFQVFCSVAEWAKLISYHEKDDEIRKFLLHKIYRGRRFPFDTTAFVGSETLQVIQCVQLNLAVCFLCAQFLVRPEVDKSYNNDIFDYVKKVFGRGEKQMTCEVKCESIPMLVKIMKIYFGMSEISAVSAFLHSSLTQLCSLLKTQNNHPNKKLIISLFTKMSLDSAYYFLAETDAMNNWYSWLLRELKDNYYKMDKKLLKVIKKIANRKYPYFLQIFSTMDFSVIKNLLKYDDEDVRDTAIFLIYNMKEITGNLLENISRIILQDPTFPKQCAVRLIRLLKCRFSEKPENGEVKQTSVYNKKGFVDFTVFLLNIAVDSYNLNNENMLDFETNNYTKAMKPLKNCHTYNILPSLHWKEHSVLFEVCFKFLRQLPQKSVNHLTLEMFKEILNNTTSLPVHCAIAILKLNHHEIKEEYYQLLIRDLTVSCLLTISVLTHMSTEDEWYKWNVHELMNSMNLNRRMAVQTIQHLEIDNSDKLEGLLVYHILRIINFFLGHRFLQPEDAKSVVHTLESLKNKCMDKTMEKQLLYHRLFRCFKQFT